MQPKFCIRCGNSLIEGDSFCRKCGAKVTAPPSGAQSTPPAPPQKTPAQTGSKMNIPSYEEVRDSFMQPAVKAEPQPEDNPEGTVLLGGPGSVSGSFGGMDNRRRAELKLSFEELLRGCSKVVDFGTGTRYELEIPAGLSPGDTILVENTGIVDSETGMGCEIELTLAIG